MLPHCDKVLSFSSWMNSVWAQPSGPCLFLSAWGFANNTSGKRRLSLFWPCSSSKSYPGLTPHMWANPSTPQLGFLCAGILFRLMHALKGTGLLSYESQNAHTQPYVGWRAVILPRTPLHSAGWIEINKRTYWTLKIWDNIWTYGKMKGDWGQLSRGGRRGLRGRGRAKCIWLLNW